MYIHKIQGNISQIGNEDIRFPFYILFLDTDHSIKFIFNNQIACVKMIDPVRLADCCNIFTQAKQYMSNIHTYITKRK